MRTFRDPVSTRQLVWRLSPEDQETFYQFGKLHRVISGMETLAVYWSDRERNHLDVSSLVELESEMNNLAYLVDYFQFLEKIGLVSLR